MALRIWMYVERLIHHHGREGGGLEFPRQTSPSNDMIRASAKDGLRIGLGVIMSLASVPWKQAVGVEDLSRFKARGTRG